MKNADYYEDLFLLFVILGIFEGIAMTILGIFAGHDTPLYWEYWLAIGLPMWIFCTVYITRGLTFESSRDIKEALTDYSR